MTNLDKSLRKEQELRAEYLQQYPNCNNYEIWLVGYILRLESQIEAAIEWIQHDCPFDADEIRNALANDGRKRNEPSESRG
jgi:hypothetical protein